MADKEKEKKVNIFKKIGKYFKALIQEMKKVNWPTRQQLFSKTTSVIIFCLIIGIIIAILDAVVGELLIKDLLGLRT